MSRKIMNKFVEICKHHPLFEVLNRDKTINWEKTEIRTRMCFMHHMHFLGTHDEGVIIPIVVTGASKVMVRTKTCETHVSL